MKSYRAAVYAATAVACAVLAGCAQDTPKSAFHDGDEYANRVLVPSALNGSVQKAVADGRPLAFNKITFTQSARVLIDGAPTNVSQDVVYENARSGGLIRGITTEYRNGVVDAKTFWLSYRGLVGLYREKILPNARRMPQPWRASSISQFDTSFDRPTLSYSYKINVYAPRFEQMDRSESCTLVSTYPGSQVAAGIQGQAKEFNCKYFNDNGVPDTDENVVYLSAYGVVIPKDLTKARGYVHFKTSNFKAI